MSKISNCLLMLEYLENGRKYNIKELAEKIEVSERMVRSYKEELEKAGTMAIWMSNANREPLKAVKKVVKEKIRLTGSAGKA